MPNTTSILIKESKDVAGTNILYKPQFINLHCRKEEKCKELVKDAI